MIRTKPVISSYEAKLLYALLDAADADGLFGRSPFAAPWEELKRMAEPFPKIDRAELYHLAEAVAASGALDHTWMRARWLTVKGRVESDPREYPASQAPFLPEIKR